MDCKKSWVRKKDYEEHFKKPNVKEGGRLVDNPCFNRKRQSSCKSLNEAHLLKRTKTLDNFAQEGRDDEELSVSKESTATDQSPESQPIIDSSQTTTHDNILRQILCRIDEIPNQIKQLITIEGNSTHGIPSSNSSSVTFHDSDDEYTTNLKALRNSTSMAKMKNKHMHGIFNINSTEDSETKIEFIYCSIFKKNVNLL